VANLRGGNIDGFVIDKKPQALNGGTIQDELPRIRPQASPYRGEIA